MTVIQYRRRSESKEQERCSSLDWYFILNLNTPILGSVTSDSILFLIFLRGKIFCGKINFSLVRKVNCFQRLILTFDWSIDCLFRMLLLVTLPWNVIFPSTIYISRTRYSTVWYSSVRYKIHTNFIRKSFEIHRILSQNSYKNLTKL